jgi:hypothetical protein
VITFYYNDLEKKLIVIHNASQVTREITDKEKIQKFLNAYNLTLEDCQEVRQGEDKLGIFAKMRINGKSL